MTTPSCSFLQDPVNLGLVMVAAVALLLLLLDFFHLPLVAFPVPVPLPDQGLLPPAELDNAGVVVVWVVVERFPPPLILFDGLDIYILYFEGLLMMLKQSCMLVLLTIFTLSLCSGVVVIIII